MEHDGFSTCFSFMEKGYLDYRLSFVSAKRMASLVDGFRRSQKQHSLLCTRATAQVLRTQSSTGRLSLSKMCEFVLGLAMPKPLDVRSVAFVVLLCHCCLPGCSVLISILSCICLPTNVEIFHYFPGRAIGKYTL